MRLLASTGLDGAIVLTFNAALANVDGGGVRRRVSWSSGSPSAEPSSALTSTSAKIVRARRTFSPREGRKHGFAVDVVPPFELDGRPVSSGPIRDALAAGRLDEATAFLGFPWFVSGEVIHGDKRGRELGFPTANLSLDAACGLRHGVYAVRVALGGRRYDGVANFGRRPMFDSGAVLLEVFLFDFAGDLYGQSIDVAFIDWIRDEEVFGSVDELVRGMNEDAARRAPRSSAPGTLFRRFKLKTSSRRRTRCSRCSRTHCAAMKASRRDRYDALPAERAAGLHCDAENFRVEQPRR